ncbi:MAG: T9SS type A sorting domain-containing protein [Dyadobacter sp.]|uniref:M64 family metallopeptidase n=1 Tax=Dyadobacter sp. TaxID=1914288 RepID=UPI001B0B8BE5|nr:M64 family metallopeptidase [Dyadobacter sp.]MBO9612805.1 T9SS type A sorting domain-containing protein [Dyadobacter sp.]
MRALIFMFCATFAVTNAFGQRYQVDTLQKTGSLDNRINVVILGDGFTNSEMPKFAGEARKFADLFLTFEPYSRYRDYFNFFAIRTPSRQSGVTNPGNAPDAYPNQPVETKDTFFGATFGSFVHRSVQLTKQDVLNDLLSTHLPAYDVVVAIVNTPYYGGSGGLVAVFTLNEAASSIGMHEIGHTLGHLGDEYWGSGVSAREVANMTANSDPTTIKWKNWLDTSPIAIYPYGLNGEAALWNKPANGTCQMEFLDRQLCAVCREEMVERLLQYVNPIEKIEPDTIGKIDVDVIHNFKLKLLNPVPNTLRTEWRLNGRLISASGDELNLKSRQVSDMSILTAAVFDSVGLSRRDGARALRTHSVEWQLKSSIPAVFHIAASADSLCAGEELTLTAYGCAGALEWSTFENTKTIHIRPSTSGIYEARCRVSGKTTTSAEASVKVLPLPKGTIKGGGIYYEGQIIQLNAAGGKDYKWTGPGHFFADTPDISIQNARTTDSGIYQVEILNAHGCSVTAKAEVKVDPLLSVSNDPQISVVVSPNPARDYLFVETKLQGKSIIQLYDQAGREVLTKSFEKKTDIKLNVAAGIYMYRFTNGSREVSGKIAVQ